MEVMGRGDDVVRQGLREGTRRAGGRHWGGEGVMNVARGCGGLGRDSQGWRENRARHEGCERTEDDEEIGRGPLRRQERRQGDRGRTGGARGDEGIACALKKGARGPGDGTSRLRDAPVGT